ncbi:hypothetical protein L9F63_015112, partial [Diploptera punctata]
HIKGNGILICWPIIVILLVLCQASTVNIHLTNYTPRNFTGGILITILYRNYYQSRVLHIADIFCEVFRVLCITETKLIHAKFQVFLCVVFPRVSIPKQILVVTTDAIKHFMEDNCCDVASVDIFLSRISSKICQNNEQLSTRLVERISLFLC